LVFIIPAEYRIDVRVRFRVRVRVYYSC